MILKVSLSSLLTSVSDNKGILTHVDLLGGMCYTTKTTVSISASLYFILFKANPTS